MLSAASVRSEPASVPSSAQKIILLPRYDPAYRAAVAARPEPGKVKVYSHGRPDSLDNKPPGEVYELLLKRGWRQGTPIELWACRTAEGPDSFAERLHRLTQSPVAAMAVNDRSLAFWDFGPSAPYKFFGGLFVLDVPGTGQWVYFGHTADTPKPRYY